MSWVCRRGTRLARSAMTQSSMLLLPIGFFSLTLRAPAAGPGSPSAAYRPAYERNKSARMPETVRMVPMLCGAACWAALGALGQRNAGELIYEAHAKEAAHYRQDDRDHQRQQGTSNPCLRPERLASRPAA